MKKGEIRKKEILKVHSSKGSFYHHYESKESLLEAMCIQRAGQIAQKAAEESVKLTDPVKKLNCLMTGIFPLSEERLSFLLMLLPVFSTQEGKSVRNC